MMMMMISLVLGQFELCSCRPHYLKIIMMMTIKSPFGQLIGLWVPFSGLRDVFT
jgi:hypothetical protein